MSKRLLALIPLALALAWWVYRQRVERVAPSIPFAPMTVTPPEGKAVWYYPYWELPTTTNETWCYGGGSGC